MRAVYAGSFDPITNGHLDIIKRAAPLCDELLVAVGRHRAKTPMFEPGHRMDLIGEAIAGVGLEVRDADSCRDGDDLVFHSPVLVDSFTGLLVDYAKRHRCDAIVRGVRVLSDFDAEFRMGLANRDLAGVETLFLLTDPDHIFVSSSMVKEIAACSDAASFHDNVSRYVPGNVYAALYAFYRPR